MDQNSGICPEPIKTDWVVAKAAGELPWFGLIKLSFSGTLGENPAPANSWVMLIVSIALLLIIPTVVEKIWEKHRERAGETGDEEGDEEEDGPGEA